MFAIPNNINPNIKNPIANNIWKCIILAIIAKKDAIALKPNINALNGCINIIANIIDIPTIMTILSNDIFFLKFYTYGYEPTKILKWT